MSGLSADCPLLHTPAFWPRVSGKSWRAIEDVVSPRVAADHLGLGGALVESAVVPREPSVLARLRDLGIGYLVDPQSLRFASKDFLTVAALRELPYAPAEAIVPGAEETALSGFVEGALAFQERAGAAAYVVPGPPLRGPSDDWPSLHERVLELAVAMNGPLVTRKPLVSLLAPDRKMLSDPESVLGALRDRPVEAVYVLPLRLNPIRASTETLVAYVEFLLALRDASLGVIAGRMGAFGLVLQALGLPIFDSGLCEAESSNLAGLEGSARRRATGARGGGQQRRVYLEPLKTTVGKGLAEMVLRDRSVRSRFGCARACCLHSGINGPIAQNREHFLRTRHDEVAELQIFSKGSRELAIEHITSQLVGARELGAQIERLAKQQWDGRPFDFDHLDRWLGVIARVTHDQGVKA